jgi:hypothetical protein
MAASPRKQDKTISAAAAIAFAKTIKVIVQIKT